VVVVVIMMDGLDSQYPTLQSQKWSKTTKRWIQQAIQMWTKHQECLQKKTGLKVVVVVAISIGRKQLMFGIKQFSRVRIGEDKTKQNKSSGEEYDTCKLQLMLSIR
jgi:hypothetical protein